MKILCVDDDAAILIVLETSLATIGGHTVTTAETGDMALADYVSQDEDFDCFVLDIQMPGLSGIDLCREIRQRPHYDRVPILMLTAMSDVDYIEQAFKNGATDYVSKPFDPNELIQRVQTAHLKLPPPPMETEPEAPAHAKDQAALDTPPGRPAVKDDILLPADGSGGPIAPAFGYLDPAILNPDAAGAKYKQAATNSIERPEKPETQPVPSNTAQVQGTPYKRKILLETPVNIQNLERGLSRGNFENFINRMSSVGKKDSYIFGFGIEDIRSLHAQHNDTRFEFLLRETAQILSGIFEPHALLFAYYGNGVFCGSTRSQDHGFLETLPEDFADRSQGIEDTSHPMVQTPVTIVNGPVSTPGLLRSLSARVKKVVKKPKVWSCEHPN